MTRSEILAAILSAVCDLLAPNVSGLAQWRVSVIGPDMLLLWDSRTNADIGLAATSAREFGVVEALTTKPFIGVLVKVPIAEETAPHLIARYAAATKNSIDC